MIAGCVGGYCEHKDSLEELILANSDAGVRHLPGDFAASLVEFGKLKRLAIPPSFLQQMANQEMYDHLRARWKSYSLNTQWITKRPMTC